MKALKERRQHYYHGTSSTLAKSILTQGFLPNPKQKVWDQGTGGLASYDGTYFTQNVITAVMSALKATEKFGGDRVIFEVQIETRTGQPDEDEMLNPLDALRRAVDAEWNAVLAGRIVRDLLFPEAFDLEDERAQAEQDIQKIVNLTVEEYLRRIQGLRRYQRISGAEDLPEKFLAALRPRVQAVVTGLLSAAKKTLITQLKITNVQTQMWKVVNFPDFRDVSSHPEFRTPFDALMRSIGGKLISRSAPGEHSSDANIRITGPVGFKGANRIISASIYEVNSRARDNEPFIRLKPIYGKPTPQMIADLTRREGRTAVVESVATSPFEVPEPVYSNDGTGLNNRDEMPGLDKQKIQAQQKFFNILLNGMY